MAFTKKHSRENRKMYTRAVELWEESGYNPAETPTGSMFAQRDFIGDYVDSIMTVMLEEFPGIDHDRVIRQVMSAQRAIYSDWRRK